MNDGMFNQPRKPALRSFHIRGETCHEVPMPIPAHWSGLARQKGYDLVARIVDRYHLALRCHACGELSRDKVFTLRTGQPTCKACQNRRWRKSAEVAEARLVRRCTRSHRYTWLRLPCGHEVRRQMGRARKVAQGKAANARVAFHCDTCHAERLACEARDRGWRLIGPDPKGDANYRLYAHGCGHQQRIARANMQSGRFVCADCGEAWTTAPSGVYLMRFVLPNSRVLMKLGMSRDADSRLHHQLLRHDEIEAEILDYLPMKSGQLALKLERGVHAILRKRAPQHVVPREVFERHLRVKSEIYEPVLEPFLRDMFNLARRSGTA